jgi:eukaryotic-like serine/threonine-protein kinase
MLSCPGEGTLRLLGTDALGDATYSAIEQHVDGCPDCQRVLERLAPRRIDRASAAPGPERFPCIPGFEIQSELGRGAMGVVYLAIETGLGRLVALKVLAGVPGPDAAAGRRRWLREARAVARVRHPHIVPLYHFGEADGRFFLVFEYVPGGTLKQRLAEPAPPRVAARLVESIARAVGRVHGQGLCHLDLKPSNILLECAENASWDRVTPRISDFGLAHSDADTGLSQTSIAGLRGTPSYMAPEQATACGAKIGAAADIHALGAILYELLTGRPPFQGASVIETLDQVRGQNPVPPRRLNPRIPRELETVALKCLEKNPARRYASAEALADDLDRFLTGRAIGARPVSPLEHGWRWCRRQPLIAGLAATLLVTLTAGVVGLLALLRRSEAQRAHSEAAYKVAARALDKFSWIVAARILDKGIVRPDDELENALESVSSQEIELSRQYPLDAAGLRRLAALERHLGSFRGSAGTLAEARWLLDQSFAHWEASLRLAPADMETHCGQFSTVALMLALLIDRESDQPYQLWNARAITVLERMKTPDQAHIDAEIRLSHLHRAHAETLRSRGESDLAAHEIHEDVARLRAVRAVEHPDPALGLCAALDLAALGEFTDELVVDTDATSDQSAQSRPRPNIEQALGELAARRFGLVPPIMPSPALVPEELPPEEWSQRVICRIQRDAAKLGVSDDRIATIGWEMVRRSNDSLKHQRWSDKLDDARRVVDRLRTLAEQLAQSYPTQAAASMALCEAYLQRAKIAYRMPGEPVVEWERRSLDAALKAIMLEPENDDAQRLAGNRRGRWAKLVAR